MAKRRPQLTVGDVCKLSKASRFRQYFKNAVIVVSAVSGDSTDGFTEVDGFITYDNWFRRTTKRIRLNRKDLWFTGYKAGSKNAKTKSVYLDRADTIGQHQGLGSTQNNNGFKNCLKCGQPTKHIPGLFPGSGYDMCANPQCVWYKN